MILRFIMLGCDFPDCAAESPAEAYLTETRKRAKKAGWRSIPDVGDYCPRHAATQEAS